MYKWREGKNFDDLNTFENDKNEKCEGYKHLGIEIKSEGNNSLKIKEDLR